MINIEHAVVDKIIYHKVGIEDTNFQLNDELFVCTDEEENVLKTIFLKPFSNSYNAFEFKHAIDLNLNPLFTFAKAVLENNNFINDSKDICQHLKTVSKHPNIKDGDVFVMKLNDVKLDDNFYEALGIFKVENKQDFLETTSNNDSPTLSFKKGIGTKRLDKACLIIFTKEPYTIFNIDNNSADTEYWQEEFISMAIKNDNANNTNQFLALTKTYLTEHMPAEFQVNKADQIDLLNRSVGYFKAHDEFDKQEFESEVLHHDDLINSFRSFEDKYKTNNEVIFQDNFTISEQAVKKQARIFKSIIKLDKNFHIYIHGNKEMIEQGVDANGRKFYKIYYEEER
jgi:hypothetical protein